MKKAADIFVKAVLIFFPWKLRRYALWKIYGYEINQTAKIGLSWVYPKRLIMKKGSLIGHLNVAINLDEIYLDKEAKIGRSNWITGFSSGTSSRHFSHQPDRLGQLKMGPGSVITKQHHIDCTNLVTIGKFSSIAGYQSQLLTHAINLSDNRQDSKPIIIGDYCFIGTSTVILGGSVLPNYCALGAKSLLNKKLVDEWHLYGGVPALPIKQISKDAAWFNREDSYTW